MKKDRVADYSLDDFFQFVNSFPVLLLCKINFLEIFDMGDFFRFLLYRELLKFRLNQTFHLLWNARFGLLYQNILFLNLLLGN